MQKRRKILISSLVLVAGLTLLVLGHYGVGVHADSLASGGSQSVIDLIVTFGGIVLIGAIILFWLV